MSAVDTLLDAGRRLGGRDLAPSESRVLRALVVSTLASSRVADAMVDRAESLALGLAELRDVLATGSTAGDLRVYREASDDVQALVRCAAVAVLAHIGSHGEAPTWLAACLETLRSIRDGLNAETETAMNQCVPCNGTGKVSDDGQLDGTAGECPACDGGRNPPEFAAPASKASDPCPRCGCAWTYHEAHGNCPCD